MIILKEIYRLSSVVQLEREREREMFYLTTHSTHFIYGYMASDIWLRTILIVRKETRCRHIGYSFRLAARVLLYAPSHIHIDARTGFLSKVMNRSNAGSLHSPLSEQPIKTIVWRYKNVCVWGARRSSEVERSLMVRWVVGSILHGVDPLSYFSFQPVLHDWCKKGRSMCYPVCGMVHIKEPLLLIDKVSLHQIKSHWRP